MITVGKHFFLFFICKITPNLYYTNHFNDKYVPSSLVIDVCVYHEDSKIIIPTRAFLSRHHIYTKAYSLYSDKLYIIYTYNFKRTKKKEIGKKTKGNLISGFSRKKKNKIEIKKYTTLKIGAPQKLLPERKNTFNLTKPIFKSLTIMCIRINFFSKKKNIFLCLSLLSYKSISNYFLPKIRYINGFVFFHQYEKVGKAQKRKEENIFRQL